ncbi:MAG: riboflavin synthase [Verrucomicrobia bacterium]|nr:riboflavin synthase [Verrucomicrobiota bacterium]MCH8513546.1 riboflavin synthase [Kiritimatiellia bacterium]
MFTGIIQKIGIVSELLERQGGRRLILELTPWERAFADGESIAVNGVCLTVAEQLTPEKLAFDVLEETLRKTNLGRLTPGGKVNLERALRYGDALGGHLVSGHVDARGIVRSITPAGGDRRVEIAAPESVYVNLVEQGSIACDGISLTVAELLDDAFAVHLIPTTLRETNWGEMAEGDEVNLEADMVCKIVRREAAQGKLPGGWTWERFQREGVE